MKRWLSDLASELIAADGDGSLPPLALDRLWVRDDGRVVLLDHPAPGSKASEGERAWLMPVALLAAVVTRAWGADARPGGPSGLPLSARRLGDRLSRPSLPSLFEARESLAAAASSQDRVRRWRRAIPAVLASVPAMVLGAAGLVLLPSLSRITDVETTMLGLLSELGRPIGEGRVPDAEGREALAIYVAGRYGTLLRDEGFWNGAVMQNMPPTLHASAREVLAQHPTVAPEELARASVQLAPQIREAEAHYRTQAPQLAHGAWILLTALLLFAVGFSLVCSLVSSLAVPGGIVLRLLGFAVVDGRGAEIGRLRSVVRVVVAWLPVIVWLAYVLSSPRVQSWVPNPVAPLLSVSLMAALMSMGVAWMIVFPGRGLHDRVVRTWVVGR